MGMALTGNVGPEEVLESSGVVEVEVAHYDGFDVFDVVAGCFDSVRKLHLQSEGFKSALCLRHHIWLYPSVLYLLGVDGARKQVSERCAPFLCSYWSVDSAIVLHCRLAECLRRLQFRHPQRSRSRTRSSPCVGAR